MKSIDLTERIIGAAIAVHRELGPGFLESIYEEAFCIALADSGLRFSRQLPVPILFRGRPVGEHRLDVVVEEAIVVELKAVTEIHDIHFATLRSYLKATGSDHGLILNFAGPTLAIRRVGREWHSRLQGRNQA